MFHKGVKATWESNKFFERDVGPCDPQVKISLEIFESFGHADFRSNGKGNDACTDKELVKCRIGQFVSVDLAIGHFSNLSNLVNLTLVGNGLSRSIPHILTTLSQLQLIDVSNSNLSGPIPKFLSRNMLIT